LRTRTAVRCGRNTTAATRRRAPCGATFRSASADAMLHHLRSLRSSWSRVSWCSRCTGTRSTVESPRRTQSCGSRVPHASTRVDGDDRAPALLSTTAPDSSESSARNFPAPGKHSSPARLQHRAEIFENQISHFDKFGDEHRRFMTLLSSTLTVSTNCSYEFLFSGCARTVETMQCAGTVAMLSCGDGLARCRRATPRRAGLSEA
jgi:hypothetical protein